MASRRAADLLIAAGAVLVNGHRPPPSGVLIDPERDRVTVHGRRVLPRRPSRYLALNKPLGTLVTAADPQGRPTVFDLVGGPGEGRLFAVGRLDAATTGLLLLTDDGELAYRLSHPRYKVPKEYVAVVRGIPSRRDLEALRCGVELEDGRTLPAEAELLDGGTGRARVRLVIVEGRNHQVRRMLAAVGHPVEGLTRTAVGPVRLHRLRPGTWRRLRPSELAALRLATGLAGGGEGGAGRGR
ncbi:MAG TPA: pseudouridine synthase [Candidatus Dormibacteraeota bacterium]|nr:pseudouridine synthase [Candidatus Dormibacteraeota bacterium]